MKKQANELIEQAYYRGYKAGYEACKEPKDALIEKGRNDAWQAAKKILTMGSKKQNEIFGAYMDLNVIESVSASEAIEKIRAYEEQKKQKEDAEIKVGDEVYLLDENYHSVVTCVFDKNAVCITQNGKWNVTDLNNLHKTGRTFPQIAEVLKKMQEDKVNET